MKIYGAGNRNRTRDNLITNQVLYLLSYTGKQGERLQTPTPFIERTNGDRCV